MGRHRTIDRGAVLEAAERVVSRDGAARMTLDAVAAEANISKASVLYDYKTKDALIRAIIDRRVAAENERVTEVVAALGDVPDRLIRGRIAAAVRPVSDEDRSVAISLCAAAAQDAALRSPIQTAYADWIDRIECSSERPRGALLAFLALEGLMLLEWFGLHSWPDEEREQLLAEIDWLRSQSPVSRPNQDARSKRVPPFETGEPTA